MFDQLNYVASGLVIADEMTNANVLIMDVFTALFRVDPNVPLPCPEMLIFCGKILLCAV